MNLAVFGVLGSEVFAHLFGHQMTPIAGRIDQHIVGGRSNRTVERHFQRLVAGLAVLEGQVVAVDDEAFGPVGHQLDDIGQIDQIGLVDLDQAQTPGRISVQTGFDQRRLAGAARAGQQDIVGRSAGHKLAGIALDQALGIVDVVQIVERNRAAMAHRRKPGLSAKGRVTTAPAKRHCRVPVGLGGLGQQRFDAGE